MNSKITNNIRNKFEILRVKQDLRGVIEYLSSLLTTNNPDNTLAGFCYWNISDSYAMLRMPNELYSNHLSFWKMLSCISDKHRFWAVCDATQRFTLELGGYGEFWWEFYKTGVQLNSDVSGIEYIAFESHNAALSINSKVKSTQYNLQIARDNFKNLIKVCKNTESLIFYKLVYSSNCLTAFGDEEYDILNLCNTILPWLKEEKNDNILCCGEWEKLNGCRSKNNMASVGLNRAINAFINVGKKEIARALYSESLKCGLPKNDYVEKRI